MRLVVTGGAGFIGSHIVDMLARRGDEILIVDDLSTGRRSNLPVGVRVAELAVGHPELSSAFADFMPDATIHCAAQAAVPVSMQRPGFDAQVNIVGGLNVMAASVGAGVDRFVYVNTGGALYGEPERLPCKEDDPIRPISPYGLSKWTLEVYLGMLLPPAASLVTLRLANVYGPRQDPHGEAGVVAIFAERMLEGREMTIFGDGEQTRDFVYVTDVARSVEAALAFDGRTSVNIGAGRPFSVRQVFDVLSELTGYECESVHAPARPGDVRHIFLDVQRARDLLGWQATTSMEEGLRLTVDHLRSTRDVLRP